MSRIKEAAKLKKLYKLVEAARGLSHPKLAKLMKTDKSQISHMMNGRNPINLERGLQFCQLLGIDLGDFSPRLEAQANRLVNMVEGKVSGTVGDVRYLVGLDMKEIAKVLETKSETENLEHVFWPGAHSHATYILQVEGQSNAPELPHGAHAVVDTDKGVEVNSLVCITNRDGVSFGKYLGDDYIELLNPIFPDRIFKLKKTMSIVGVVIGVQLSK